MAGVAGAAGASLLMVTSAAGLTGCSLADDMVMGLGTETETAHGRSTSELPGPDQAEGVQSNALVVTPRQRSYLDALHEAGVEPTSDLAALSIGSYVCQARAANQTDQQVWDFVTPLVRNEFGDPGMPSVTPPAGAIRSATSDYIRIATEHLC